jgi:hypothetical protein
MTCVVCGDRLDRKRGARAGRCGTCANYRYQKGVDRSKELIVKLTERDIERERSRRR